MPQTPYTSLQNRCRFLPLLPQPMPVSCITLKWTHLQAIRSSLKKILHNKNYQKELVTTKPSNFDTALEQKVSRYKSDGYAKRMCQKGNLMNSNDNVQFFVSCPPGLEQLLAKECVSINLVHKTPAQKTLGSSKSNVLVRKSADLNLKELLRMYSK